MLYYTSNNKIITITKYEVFVHVLHMARNKKIYRIESNRFGSIPFNCRFVRMNEPTSIHINSIQKFENEWPKFDDDDNDDAGWNEMQDLLFTILFCDSWYFSTVGL